MVKYLEDTRFKYVLSQLVRVMISFNVMCKTNLTYCANMYIGSLKVFVGLELVMRLI